MLLDRSAAAMRIFSNRQAAVLAVFWQHCFWSFGHPEVYIMILPAFGIISEVIPVFSRKPIYGYEFVAGSSVAIAFLSFGVWVHHMFAVGLGHFVDTGLCRQQHADRGPDRHEDFQLDRDDVRRRASASPPR